MQLESHAHGHFHHRKALQAFADRNEGAHQNRPSRGERIVARLDQNDDGQLGISELADTKFGRRMSVDGFARLDRNGDSMLDAAELDKGMFRRRGSAMIEAAMRARFADHLAEKLPDNDAEDDVASMVIQRLDADESGALNSEEIAGTRLAKAIGGEFYNIDADKNGALDKAELSNFIAGHLSGRPGDVAEIETETANDDDVEDGRTTVSASPAASDLPENPEVGVTPTAEPVSAPVAAASTDSFATSAGAKYAEDIRNAFEAALEVLKEGSGEDSAADIVQVLYENVQNILNT